MICKANADDTVKLAIEAENKFRAINAAQYEAGYAAAEEKYTEELQEKDETILSQANALQEKDNEIAALKARLAELEAGKA